MNLTKAQIKILKDIADNERAVKERMNRLTDNCGIHKSGDYYIVTDEIICFFIKEPIEEIKMSDDFDLAYNLYKENFVKDAKSYLSTFIAEEDIKNVRSAGTKPVFLKAGASSNDCKFDSYYLNKATRFMGKNSICFIAPVSAFETPKPCFFMPNNWTEETPEYFCMLLGMRK